MPGKEVSFMSIVDGFIELYRKKYDFYRETGRICAQICETNMEQMGIRAIVTHRAKKAERLRDKLEKRNADKKYESFDDISEDIKDLSGVRIALYFPGDLYKVQQFIDLNFRVVDCKIFPEAQPKGYGQDKEYKKRFTGYWATHYRVYLKEKNLSEEEKKYSDTMIEIQIASALMHAWAEVEHDLVYKPFSGELSYEEYQILDELNGMVLAGEIALERLQKAVKNRVSQSGTEFNNHYEVASFINNKLGPTINDSQGETALGRVDLLFKCIKTTEFNKPEKLKELISYVTPENRDRSVVDQIMDGISEINASLYEEYRNMKHSEELKLQLDTLHMNSENGNRQGEANTLANIGYLYSSREDYDKAIDYFMKAVDINNEIGGIQGEANQLLNVGSTYRLKGDMDKAFEYCSKALALHKQISYRQGQAYALGMIGNIYSDRQDYDSALTNYNESLDIYVDTGYKFGEITQLNNLGRLFKKKKEFEISMQYFEKALALAAQNEVRQGEGDALHNIGDIYFEKADIMEAIAYYEKALSIQKAVGNERNMIANLRSIGNAYEDQNDYDKALHYYQEALYISSNNEYKKAEEEALENIARIQKITKR